MNYNSFSPSSQRLEVHLGLGVCSGQTPCQVSAVFGDSCLASGAVSVPLPLCPVGKCCRGWNGTALLSPQRCKWVLLKEDLLLKPGTDITALSDFNLMEPSLFKSHHS